MASVVSLRCGDAGLGWPEFIASIFKLRIASTASSHQKPEKGLEQTLFTWPQEGPSLTQTSSLLGESILVLFRVIQFMATSEQPWKLVWWKSCAI